MSNSEVFMEDILIVMALQGCYMGQYYYAYLNQNFLLLQELIFLYVNRPLYCRFHPCIGQIVWTLYQMTKFCDLTKLKAFAND